MNYDETEAATIFHRTALAELEEHSVGVCVLINQDGLASLYASDDGELIAHQDVWGQYKAREILDFLGY
jgi:hypothetical protein